MESPRLSLWWTSCTSSRATALGQASVVLSALQYGRFIRRADSQSQQPVASAVRQLQRQRRSLLTMTRVEMNQGFPQGLLSEMNECGERTPFLKSSVAALRSLQVPAPANHASVIPAFPADLQQEQISSARRWKGHCWRRRMLERHSIASSVAIRSSPLSASALASGISALSPRTSSSSQI